MKKCKEVTLEEKIISSPQSSHKFLGEGAIVDEFMSRTSAGRVKKAAFTLAETLITLTILGVIAAITVPSLINKQIESANRTKVKKAMAVYEKALNQMIIDNDIKSDIGTTLDDATCSKTNKYFKIVEGSNCRFKTSDRVWWDITKIENPIIILKDDYKNTPLSAGDTNLQSLAQLSDNKDVFAMIGYLDTNGVLRINDLGVAKDGETAPTAKNKTYLDKLYGFMGNKTIEEDDSDKPFYQTKEWKNAKHPDIEDDYSEDTCHGVYKNCYVTSLDLSSIYYMQIYDENGTPTGVSCRKGFTYCSDTIFFDYSGGFNNEKCYEMNDNDKESLLSGPYSVPVGKTPVPCP